jgi:hypothetical protein
MEMILPVMGHEGDPEGLPVSPAVLGPPIPEGLMGVSLRILVAEDNERHAFGVLHGRRRSGGQFGRLCSFRTTQ